MKIQKAEIRGQQSAVSQRRRFQVSGFRSQVSGFRFQVLGFTLVELLVVITIIAMLAGLLLPVIIGAIGKAEKTRAINEVNAIAAAMENYLQEYSKFPNQTAGSASDHQYGATEYKQLIDTLRGSNFTWGGSGYSNPRSHVFLSVDEKNIITNSPGGGTYAARSQELSDPWGNRYQIIADWNFDNKISSPMADGATVNGRSVAVWSLGPKSSTMVGDATHIRSWK
jgi:prepilin-type N-terminal cleavage/methylation domain-containing protein